MIKKLAAILLLLGLFASCHVGRFIVYNFSDVRDYKKFPEKKLARSAEPFYFKEAAPGDTGFRMPRSVVHGKKKTGFEDALINTGTIAFLAIRNDSILYQWYRPGKDASVIVPSFSMAKSYVSALVGIAIGEGAIKSAEEPITHYLDYLDTAEFGKVTIQHLLDMRSGIRSIENYYNPFGDVAKYYYGRHLKKYMRRLRMEKAPDRAFDYISLNTQLLGLIVEKATGRSLTAYLQEKIWTPVGAEFDAGWSIDSEKEGTEKAFCCINARARDYAKLGRLYLHKGSWNGRQLVPEAWVTASVTFTDTRNNFVYSNQWWHNPVYTPFSDTVHYREPYNLAIFTSKDKKHTASFVRQPAEDYYAQGHLGQFIYVHPLHNMVIVRLGRKEGWIYWPGLFSEIAGKN